MTPLFLLSTPKVIWSGSDSPRAGLLGLLRVERVCVGYLLFVLSLVRTVLVQNCKGKPPVATGGKDEP